MLESFTERVRMAVVLTQEEAVRFDYNHIGTEYILLGQVMESEVVVARAVQPERQPG